MDFDVSQDERTCAIANWLLKHSAVDQESPQNKWGEIANHKETECPKKVANQFLLCCLLDYQSKADPWKRGRRFIEEISKRPDEVWAEIGACTKEEWESDAKFGECGLHWMHKAHNRIWPIAKRICFWFDGDARRIWQKSNSFDTLCRLYYLGAGEQISRMIVGALKDCGLVSGKCDVKADVYICRVLGRAILGKDASPPEAVALARRLHPSDPWQLDWPLWNIGKSYCEATTPKCSNCDLATNCLYAHWHPS